MTTPIISRGDDDLVEIDGPPAFEIGDKVRSRKYIKNDGTFPMAEIGEVLVKKGDVGYVTSIGTFLQRYYIYAIDFIEQGKIVGMKGSELLPVQDSAGETADQESE